MRITGDFCTTPHDVKVMVDEIARIRGLKRKSDMQEDGLFKNRFLAVESVTSAFGFKLVIVKKNKETIDAFPNVPPMGVEEFRRFVKGLLIGLELGEEKCKKMLEEKNQE